MQAPMQLASRCPPAGIISDFQTVYCLLAAGKICCITGIMLSARTHSHPGCQSMFVMDPDALILLEQGNGAEPDSHKSLVTDERTAASCCRWMLQRSCTRLAAKTPSPSLLPLHILHASGIMYIQGNLSPLTCAVLQGTHHT